MSGDAAPRFGIPLSALIPALGALVALWFLRTALVPFFAAIVLAYLMQPLASRLARWLSRGWAAVFAILAFTLGFGLFIWALVPPFVAQMERLLASLPAWQAQAIQRWLPWFQAHPAVLAKLRQALEALDPVEFLNGARLAGAGLVAWFLELMTLVLVPLIVYYLLVEGPNLTRGLDELIPARFKARINGLAAEINNRMGGYIRGQLSVAAVMSLLQGLGFQILGVPYPWVLGLLAGVANVVPYSPYVTALPLALLFSALAGAGWAHLLLVVVVFELVQKAEAFYFTPVWVGRASGLHPLEVLLAMFCFGYAFGIFGLIFAVPLMIVAKTLCRALVAHYQAQPWFNRNEGGS
ncbi:MAG: AI-2E family transporter [Holophaga sp.]|nr:AI-2E family transporter [Holophaga sp.]